MKSTKIYIDENILHELEIESKIKKETISDIIKSSIEERQEKRINNILSNLDGVQGIWKDKDINIEEYIKDLRMDRSYDND